MEDISMASIKRKNIINKIVFIILCVLIALLLTFNIVMISTAYFTDSRYTNPSVVTTGNIAISYLVKDKNDNTISTPIVLSASELLPGDAINYTIDVTNDGTNSCYIRMKCKFEIKIDAVYQENSIVIMEYAENYNGGFSRNETVNNKTINYLYYNYNSAVPTTAPGKTVSFPIKLKVNESKGQELIDAGYAGKQYRITITIEALQSTGVIQSANENASGWVDAVSREKITLFD
jgi:hypothetical protein